jgi:hypothetical protein
MYGQQSGRPALEAALVVLTALSVMYAAVFTFKDSHQSARKKLHRSQNMQLLLYSFLTFVAQIPTVFIQYMSDAQQRILRDPDKTGTKSSLWNITKCICNIYTCWGGGGGQRGST